MVQRSCPAAPWAELTGVGGNGAPVARSRQRRHGEREGSTVVSPEATRWGKDGWKGAHDGEVAVLRLDGDDSRGGGILLRSWVRG